MLLSTVCNMLYFTQSRLLPDADGFGFIPTDYADTVRGLEALHGDREGQWSIRINDQWRICFRWEGDGAHDVEIVDYH